MNTPILLITFNRPDHTRQTLQRILEAQPRDLYVFQDGAREGNANDAIKCQQVRDVINELVSEATSSAEHHIKCEAPHQAEGLINLHTYYSSENLGCGKGPMTGISWFFDNVEQGIVMEDDCLAHPDFFPYCEELLNRYKGTEVKFINSTLYDDRWTNALNHQSSIASAINHQSSEMPSYGFSRYMVTGAWASYREVWQGFDLDLKLLNLWKFAKHVYTLTESLAEAEHWYYVAREIQDDNSKKSYWDYQIQIHLFRQNAITVHPAINLISNIGFDAEGTHTKGNDGRGDREFYPIMPLNHPDTVVVNTPIDNYSWAKKRSRGFISDCLLIIYHLWAWRNRKSI